MVRSENDNKMNYILSIIAGFLSGVIGSMGFGGGGILIIYLVVFAGYPQVKAQGINLIFFIPLALVSVIIYTYKKEIKYKEILPVIVGGILGTIPSIYLLNFLKTEYLSKIFGLFLIGSGIFSIINIKKRK